MGLFKPAWLKDDEEAAIRAIQKETNRNKLTEATTLAWSYRVRSIAFEKLGRLQGAKYEIALHDPDEATCLLALDEVDWDGWDWLLAELAVLSGKEAVALKALFLIQDEKSLATVASRTRNGIVARQALDRIKNADALKSICEKSGFMAPPTSVRLEAARRLGDRGELVAILDGILPSGADAVLTALDDLWDEGFREELLAQWLDTSDKALVIAEKFKGKEIAHPPVGEELEGFCCPDGCLHDIEVANYGVGADTDERYGVITCKRCGYEYEVDDGLIRFGKNRGYTFRRDKSKGRVGWIDEKKVRYRPAGYPAVDEGGSNRQASRP